MFRLVRFFLLTSAIAAVIVAASVIFYRQSEIQRLVDLVERQNVTLAQSLTNTMRPRYSFLLTRTQSDQNVLVEMAADIGHAMQAALAGLPVLKVKIYDLSGRTVFSSESAEIGEDQSANIGFISAAREGQPASKLTSRDTIGSFDASVQDRDLIESYLPIYGGDGAIEGVFELYTDVTPLMSGIRRSTINHAAGFSVVFGLLYGLLFLIVLRADRTIKQQYVDITEKNVALRREISERRLVEEALGQARDELEERVIERTQKLTQEIAERKRAEEEARQHRNELARFGRISIMGELATSLAHELNQPLAVISGSAQFCADRLRKGKTEREVLLDTIERLAEQADRANEIIRRIRSFVQKDKPERRNVDVNNVIRSLAHLLHSDAREHDVAIELELDSALAHVVADPIQLQQVIVNLVHNGLEAMVGSQSRSPGLKIRTSMTEDGKAEVAVCDEGIGIPSDVLDRVFDPFFSTKSDGLGMGLSISRTIVEAHGGRLWVTSDRKTGTVFHFTLPTTEGMRAHVC